VLLAPLVSCGEGSIVRDLLDLSLMIGECDGCSQESLVVRDNGKKRDQSLKVFRGVPYSLDDIG